MVVAPEGVYCPFLETDFGLTHRRRGGWFFANSSREGIEGLGVAMDPMQAEWAIALLGGWGQFHPRIGKPLAVLGGESKRIFCLPWVETRKFAPLPAHFNPRK